MDNRLHIYRQLLLVPIGILLVCSSVNAQVLSARSNEVAVNTSREASEFKTSKIYAVIIGIAEYQDSTMNLNYADDDAKKYYDFLRSPSGGSVPQKHITLLLNKQATRANIIKALNSQFNDAFEEDLVILYIASHGRPSRKGNKLYFLGSDTDQNNVEGSAIPHSEFEEAITNSKAQKKLWIADACHAGAVVDSEVAMQGMVRGERETAEAALVNRLLTKMAATEASYIILSASSAGEQSWESHQWGGGHGVFTYYLVEGLKGAADENKNKFVDIREMYEYVREKVAAGTNQKQYPLLNGKYHTKFPMSAVVE